MILNKKDIEKSPYNKAAITGYNRLEGVPNSSDYRKSLNAAIHDPLWMLTRQWQMGEFDAEDAGTAVKTKLLVTQEMMLHIDTGNNIFPIDKPYSIPLEMLVEKEGRAPDLAFRIELGKLFKQLLIEHKLEAQLADFLEMFKLQLLEEKKHENELVATISLSKNDSQLFDAIKNRVLDGFMIFEALTQNNYKKIVNAKFVSTNSRVVINALKTGEDFLKHIYFFYGADFEKINTAWKPDSLNYQFSIQTNEDPAKATILEATNYPGRRLDWFDFDIRQTTKRNAKPATHTILPTAVTYPGMPKSRWWEMEENDINFGNINVKTTDIPTLILIDFALIYGNDWMIIPFPMKLNQLCSIEGFLVKDVFGFNTFIPPVDTNSNLSWNKWSLFSQTDLSGTTKQPLFYLTPTLLKPIEDEPLEKVSFLRDEVSNMAWAFENVIPGAMGKGLRAAEIIVKEEKKEDNNMKQDKPVSYLLGTDLPFYQVPFIPVAFPFADDHSYSQMRLQRAQMPNAVPPKGILLTENPSPYFIKEENISKAGTTIIRRWQRTRWVNGTVAQWVGREKQAGKSEGGSSLLFDNLIFL